ncbi:hypothetical protein DBV05_g10467 [Lasiodiplodia theobromae]|uniref:Uncharacterized protein n=1 Tax=Lasiodiplodia theobromae TaxID=45133 RepID=A0A5N5CZS9_9PEZI|nr:hypothetical protein DBV05_g10467 [Lasiodiplodia theobromae]
MTRSEEPAEAKQRDEEERFACEFARANIDAFPPDEEIVNSETGELYESTNASTKDEDARQKRRKILEETFLLAQRYGIAIYLRNEYETPEQILWVPYQQNLALTVVWGWKGDDLWETRIEPTGEVYELPVTSETILVACHHQGMTARE